MTKLDRLEEFDNKIISQETIFIEFDFLVNLG